jgi:hypothetical protein
MSQHQTHAIATALSLAVGFAKQRLAHQQDYALSELRAGALSNMVEALVTKKSEIVQAGFHDILEHYAEDARQYMAQQHKYADKELETTDPLTAIRLRSRIAEIDAQLADIRADAKLLYEHMTEVLLALGAPTGGFASDLAPALGITFEN